MANITNEERKRRATMAAGEAYSAPEEPSANDDPEIKFGPESFDPLAAEQVTQAVEAAVEATVASLAAPVGGSLSPELLAFAALMQQNMLLAVAEMRKPDPEEQAKRDAEKERKRHNERQTLIQLKAGEDQKRRSQGSCDHAMPNGKTLFRAQIFSDGTYRPFCVKCGFISRPIRGDQFRLNNEPINLYKLDAGQLTIARLNAMADASLPPMPVQVLPVGAEVDLSGL